MIVVILKCQICGYRFEAEIIDKEDSRERERYRFCSSPVKCPKCHCSETEIVRKPK